MGKKQFIALADRLRGVEVPPDVMEALIGFLKSENPAFMEGRWLAYLKGDCGPSGGKR